MIKAIIFDYDGLLVDTDNIWFQSCIKLCKEYGVTIPQEDREDLMRGNLSEYLVQKYALPDPKEVIKPKLADLFDGITKNGISVLPGAIELVKKLSKKYPLAVASGTNTKRLSASLKTLGIYNCFQVVIGIDQVKNGKPAPDTFLKAAEELHVDPKNCLVFEDQPKGLEAAKAASMFCIVVPNKHLKGIDYAKADKVIKSLTLVTDDIIQEIGL